MVKKCDIKLYYYLLAVGTFPILNAGVQITIKHVEFFDVIPTQPQLCAVMYLHYTFQAGS